MRFMELFVLDLPMAVSKFFSSEIIKVYYNFAEMMMSITKKKDSMIVFYWKCKLKNKRQKKMKEKMVEIEQCEITRHFDVGLLTKL